jgi:hypothetical protein
MQKLFLSEKGFTIIELLTASVVTLLFAASFYGAFFALGMQIKQQDNFYDTNQSVRYSMERMSRDVKEAVEVVSSHGSDTTSGSVLILKLPSINASGIPTNIASQFDYVTYKISSNRLVRALDVLGGTSSRDGGADRTGDVTSRGTQTVSFSSGGASLATYSASALAGLKTINVQITNQATLKGRTQTSQADSDLVLRNNL